MLHGRGAGRTDVQGRGGRGGGTCASAELVACLGGIDETSDERVRHAHVVDAVCA